MFYSAFKIILYFRPVFNKYKYHFLLHFVILIWGFTGILGVLINLEAFTLVWHRVLIASIALFIFLLATKKPFKLPSKKRLYQILFVGVIVALHWLTFYKSIQLSTASLGILCLSTTTLHVAWLEPLINKKPFSYQEFILGIVVIFGIYIVSSDFSPQDYIALAYGLCSALFAAGFAVFNAKLAKDTAPSLISFYELISAFLFISIVLFFKSELTIDLFIMTWSDFLWLLFLGVVCTSFAFLATIKVIKKLGTFTVSLSINLEPIYTIALAVVILNEDKLLNSKFYYGASVIILVVIANAVLKSMNKKPLLKLKKTN